MNKKRSAVKVCHMTSVHPAKDGRIFYKECTSLAKAGYDVTLVAAGANDEICNGVKIVGVPIKNNGRFHRMFKVGRSVYKKALEINADIYHLHDPELLPFGLKLKRKGKKVIFDSHEDYPANISEKNYLPSIIANIISQLYSKYENRVLKNIDGVISVTPHLTQRLVQITQRVAEITNYKIVNESDTNCDSASIQFTFAFIGPIRHQWCVKEILQVFNCYDNLRLNLAGSAEENYLLDLKKLPNWEYVKYYGKVRPEEVEKIYTSSSVGFALLRYCKAVGNNIGTLGNTKLFEIMGAGKPVICTDFILWKKIIEQYKCGICVNPEKPEEIINAMTYLITHPKEAKQMGENGRRAVLTEFNWKTQETILINFYDLLLQNI
ncbi:MAG: glycosyltransferase [Muribaculaceae bacterium]|nr:glycosyltransferase [Muribaculaceae bacterium]